MKVHFRLLALFVICWFNYTTQAQEISIRAVNQPLNKVLIELHKNYGYEFSFDDILLSKYSITVQKSFNSIEEALRYILKNVPLHFEKSGSVYLIIPTPQTVHKQEVVILKGYILAGRIVDQTNMEGLPFTQIQLNKTGLISDYNGSFSYRSKTDSIFKVTISYLGYYILDTLLHAGKDILLKLVPSAIGLKEIVIADASVEYGLQVSENPAEYKLNHKIATALPGYGDNSVYNLLRLQPGILAAGEQSNDLIIWGAYEGHSQVKFDGFTIQGLKNYNDNIGAINPYMVKDIKVLKAGYNASYGERVGGIIDITGITGNKKKPVVNFTIGNNTLNAIAGTPVFKNSALIVAYRQTYYNLYNAEDINTPRLQENNKINLIPDYSFRDANIKYSGNSENGDVYYLSLYRGSDHFSYDILHDRRRKSFSIYRSESNLQLGGAASYRKKWQKGAQTEILLSYSGLETNLEDKADSTLKLSGATYLFREDFVNNSIEEQSVKLIHQFVADDIHQFEIGGGVGNDIIGIKQDSMSVQIGSISKQARHLNLYALDKLNVQNKLSLVLGLRVNYPTRLKKLYLQPRISGNIPLSEKWDMKAAWGIFNQFVSKTTEVDNYGNVTYIWTTSDNVDIPVLKSNHYVAGLTYANHKFILDIEGFYKTTHGLTWVFINRKTMEKIRVNGQSLSRGIDIFLKKELKNASFWTSYTLSKTEEKLSNRSNAEYKRSLHDQRHEFKVAGILHIKRIYLSANYVYGSGFPDPAPNNSDGDLTDLPYKRLDAAVVYRFKTKRISLETGISVLNVLNHENIKYDNFVRVPDSQIATLNIHTEAVPFTPTLFLKIGI